MTAIPVGYLSRGFVEGRAREAAERGAVAITRTAASRKRLSELRRLAPTQEHPRECRCERSMPDQDGDCVKCGLALEWRPATMAERTMIAALVASEREAEYRARRRRLAAS